MFGCCWAFISYVTRFSIMAAICQCAGWISVLFHPSCHHVVYVNAFQMCLLFCWHTLDAVNIHVWVLILPPPSLLPEIVNTPHNRLTCPDDNMCVSKPIYCVHLQVISVIPPCIKPSCRVYIIVCLAPCFPPLWAGVPAYRGGSPNSLWPVCLNMSVCVRSTFSTVVIWLNPAASAFCFVSLIEHHGFTEVLKRSVSVRELAAVCP